MLKKNGPNTSKKIQEYYTVSFQNDLISKKTKHNEPARFHVVLQATYDAARCTKNPRRREG